MEDKELTELLKTYKEAGLKLDEEELKIDKDLLSEEEIIEHKNRLHKYSALEDSIIKYLMERHGLSLYETSLILDGDSLDNVLKNRELKK